MTKPPTSDQPTPSDEGGMHEAARREKLRRIEAMGIDPWGSRFDERQMIGSIRAREGEVQYQLNSGERWCCRT